MGGLAMQSQEVLEAAGKECGIASVCVYGGVSKWGQKEALGKGVEVVVATPGRLIDLMQEEIITLSQVSYLVLDEADRMLDQGFERDIRQIVGETTKAARPPSFPPPGQTQSGSWRTPSSTGRSKSQLEVKISRREQESLRSWRWWRTAPGRDCCRSC